jgi:hypothetical protein
MMKKISNLEQTIAEILVDNIKNGNFDWQYFNHLNSLINLLEDMGISSDNMRSRIEAFIPCDVDTEALNKIFDNKNSRIEEFEKLLKSREII